MCRYALMREVADSLVGKFPRSMSDFKPGDKNFALFTAIAVDKDAECLPRISCGSKLAHGDPEFILGREETPGSV